MRLKSTRCIIHTWVELQLQPPPNEHRDGEGEPNTGNHFKLDKVQACLDFTQTSSAHTSTAWHLAKIKRAHLLHCQRAPTVNKTGKQINVCKLVQQSEEEDQLLLSWSPLWDPLSNSDICWSTAGSTAARPLIPGSKKRHQKMLFGSCRFVHMNQTQWLTPIFKHIKY